MKIQALLSKRMHSIKIWILGLLLLCGLHICLLWDFAPAHAHGGVIVDSGVTEQYEWLIAINPYPVPIGESLIGVLVYDINTFEPIDGLTGELYLTPPDGPETCCQPGVHRGPIDLINDPTQFPGDYWNAALFDELGEWRLHFFIMSDELTTEISSTLEVTLLEGEGVEMPIIATPQTISETIAATVQSAAVVSGSATLTSTTSASDEGDTPQVSTPYEVTQTVESTESTSVDESASQSGQSWLLWGALGLLPILLLAVWILRSPEESS